jgi:hypothetical protein
MFTTGSKFFYGAATLAAVAAIVYGTSSGNPVFTGTIVLVALLITTSFLGGILSAFRDAHRPAAAGAEALVPDHRAAPYSLWPIAAAFTLGVTALGIAVDRRAFILGLVALLVVALEWAITAWADGASNDPAYNKAMRSRYMHALEFPVVGALGVGFIGFLFSRIMLALHETEATVVFVVMGALILGGSALLAYKPGIARKALPAMLALGAAGLLAGGVAGIANGEVDHSETKEVAGRAVAAKASVEAVIIVNEAGELNRDRLVIPKGATVNILFRNDDDGERELVFVGKRSRREGTQTVVEQFETKSELIGEKKVALVTVKFPKSGDYPFTIKDEALDKVVTGTVVVP